MTRGASETIFLRRVVPATLCHAPIFARTAAPVPASRSLRSCALACPGGTLLLLVHCGQELGTTREELHLRNTNAANELVQPRPSPHRTPRGEHVDLDGSEFAHSIQIQGRPFSPSVAEATEQRRGEQVDLDRHELARSNALQRRGETYTY